MQEKLVAQREYLAQQFSDTLSQFIQMNGSIPQEKVETVRQGRKAIRPSAATEIYRQLSNGGEVDNVLLLNAEQSIYQMTADADIFVRRQTVPQKGAQAKAR